MKGLNWSSAERKILFSPFVVKLLLIMFIVEFVKGGLIITFLPLYLEDVFKVSATMIGWTLAVQYLGDNLLRTPMGWLMDRFGYRIIMLTGVLSTLAAVVVIATTSQYYAMVIACLLLGLGTAPLWPCVITGTTEVAGKEAKGMIMSVVYIAWVSGVGLGPFVSTFFLNGHIQRALELFVILIILVVLVTFLLPGKVNAAGGNLRSKQSLRPKPRMKVILGYLREVRGSITVSPFLFPAMFAQTFALGLLIPVLTLYATKEMAMTSGQFRTFLLSGGVVAVICMIPVGKMVDRIGTKWILNTGLLLSSLILFVFTFVHSITGLYIMMMCLGLGFALVIPSWNALVSSAIPPSKRGTVWGFFLTVQGIGTTIGPIASGFLRDSHGFPAPFLASGSILFLLLLIHVFVLYEKKGGTI